MLFDQSHHMTDLFLEGPGALRLLSELAVNSFASYRPEMGKQFVAVDHAGYVIGDGILFYLGDESFDLVGTPGDRQLGRLQRTPLRLRPDGRARRPLGAPQGPPATALPLRAPGADRLGRSSNGSVGGPLPEVGFFRMARFSFAGTEVRALRHGMAGQPGFDSLRTLAGR